MPLPKNNRLSGEPNDKWAEIGEDVPTGRMLAFTDADQQFIWIGMLANELSAAPTLNDLPAAHWSEVADQPDAAFV